MRFDAFEQRAWELWDEIPEHYKEGIDGLVVVRDALPHPSLPDVYTMGECRTEAYPSEFGGPDTTRSVVVLYYGSFFRLSRLDPEFDWEDELWETLTHELQHHLEGLAAEDALEDMDYAADENFKRVEGEEFDPYFYWAGEQVEPGAYRVDRDYFIERRVPEGDPPEEVEFAWRGARYRAPVPVDPGDVCFVRVDGVDDVGPGELHVVLVRRRRLLNALARWVRGSRPVVREASAVARLAGGEAGG